MLHSSKKSVPQFSPELHHNPEMDKQRRICAINTGRHLVSSYLLQMSLITEAMDSLVASMKPDNCQVKWLSFRIPPLTISKFWRFNSLNILCVVIMSSVNKIMNVLDENIS